MNSPSENNGGTFLTRMQITRFPVGFNLSKLSGGDCCVICLPRREMRERREMKVTLLESWILLSCCSAGCCSAQSSHHVSTLQLLQSNWQALSGCVESRTYHVWHSQSPSVPHRTWKIPNISPGSRPPPAGYANYIQRKSRQETQLATPGGVLSFHTPASLQP